MYLLNFEAFVIFFGEEFKAYSYAFSYTIAVSSSSLSNYFCWFWLSKVYISRGRGACGYLVQQLID